MNRDYVVSAAITATLFGGLFLGFKAPPKAPPPEKAFVAIEGDALPKIETLKEEPLPPDPSGETEPPEIQPAGAPHLVDTSGLTGAVRSFVQPYVAQPEFTGAGDIAIIPPGATAVAIEGAGRNVAFNRGDLDVQARPRFRAQPDYPYALKAAGIEGTVTLEFIIEVDGTASSVRVAESSHPGFERAAVAALQKWRFEPGRKAGKKVRSRATQPFSFSLAQ